MNTTHLALKLPEIVNQIVFYLINIQDQEEKKRYTNIYPCLFVGSLWYNAAFKQMWKCIVFEDSKAEYESFLKFVSTAIDTLPVKSSNVQSNQTPLSVLSTYNCDANSSRVQSTKEYISTQNSKDIPVYTQYNHYLHATRSISLRKIKEKSINETLGAVAPYFQRLEKLDIYICDHLSDNTLRSFIKHNEFSTLTELSLAGCNRITNDAIISVARFCPNLLHLDLRACGQVSDKSICAIAKRCPKLQHLNVGRVRERENITIRSIGLIAKYTKVTVLGLAGCDMTDECLLILAKYRGNSLERISVNNCYRLTNKTLQAYVQHCPNLSVFEMKECHWIDDWGSVAELVQRRVLLTLCEQQSKACSEWARRNGKVLQVRAPVK